MTAPAREVRGYVRMTTLRVRPEASRLALDRFLSLSTPRVTELPGAISIVGGGNLEKGAGISFSFWDSVEALEQSSGDPETVEVLAGYAAWMAGPYTVESFVLVRGDPLSRLDGPERVARILSVIADAGDVDLALDTLDEWLAHSEAQRGCDATLLLSPLMGTRVVAVEIWRSARAIAATDARVARDLGRGTPLAGRIGAEVVTLF